MYWSQQSVSLCREHCFDVVMPEAQKALFHVTVKWYRAQWDIFLVSSYEWSQSGYLELIMWKRPRPLFFFSWTHNLNLWCRKLQQRSPSLTKTPNNVCIWPNKVLVWVLRIICGHKGTNKSNKIWQMSKSLFQFYRFKDFFFIYVFIQHILHV